MNMVQDQLNEVWSQFNVRYFRNALPPIEIAWSQRLTASAGIFISRVGPRGRRNGRSDMGSERRLIRLSQPLLRDQPEREIIGTLAHEMIHQWQYDILKRRPNHGRDFRRMMETMNHDGLGITISHSLNDEVQGLAKYTWRCRQCGRDYWRQRRTICPSRHRCGACRGRLRPILPAEGKSKKVNDKSLRSVEENPAREPAVQLALPFGIP